MDLLRESAILVCVILGVVVGGLLTCVAVFAAFVIFVGFTNWARSLFEFNFNYHVDGEEYGIFRVFEGGKSAGYTQHTPVKTTPPPPLQMDTSKMTPAPFDQIEDG